jgi:hypothetical protein
LTAAPGVLVHFAGTWLMLEHLHHLPEQHEIQLAATRAWSSHADADFPATARTDGLRRPNQYKLNRYGGN